MPIDLRESRSRTYTGTRRRIFHLLEEMGTSGDQIWPFASQPFMRSPGPMTVGKTEEWHLGIHSILADVSPEEHIVWRILNEGVDGRHGFYLSSEGKATKLEYRIEGSLSDMDGRLLWRRFEDQFERSTEALFDKINRVLRR
ncbi:MAG: hypothetical protein ACREMP_05935 [Candidatus Tyrphobacter sp.]